MNLGVLHEFITLAINRNFTETARKLNMSHSSLSRHIASLEREVGEQLIVRSNPIVLTRAGKIVLEKASQVLFELDEMERLIKENRETYSGEVRIMDLNPSFETMAEISNVLFAMRQSYPGISVLFLGPTINKDIVDAVRDKTLDIGFRYHFYKIDESGAPVPRVESFEEEGIRRISLKKLCYRLYFGIEKNHPLYDKESISFAELAKFGFIQPANKFYMDSNNSFVTLVKQIGVNPHLTYVETEGLFGLWLMNSGSSALLLSERVIDNQLLPQGFFERVRLVVPNDAEYRYEIYAICSEASSNDAANTTVALLEKNLN